MDVNMLFVVASVVGGVGLFLVWFLMGAMRDWSFPARTTEFHIERDPAASERAAELGPSGQAEIETEAEAVDRGEKTLWDRLKLELYTYQKRPKKVK